MNPRESPPTDKPADDFTKTWRYKVGLFMIIVGNLGIVIALALPFFGVPAAVVGALVVGGEIVRFWANRSIGPMSGSGATSQPSLQPVIE